MPNLTKSQEWAIRALVAKGARFANFVEEVMKANGLASNGETFRISVMPSNWSLDKYVYVKRENGIDDSQFLFSMAKGALTDGWEYGEDDTIEPVSVSCKRDQAEGSGAGTAGEKPLPPDGLWISNSDDPPADLGGV